MPDPSLDGHELEAKEEMPHRPPRLVKYRYVMLVHFLHCGPLISRICIEFLQERVSRETTQPEFSQMPFRFAEIAKVVLDVCVVVLLIPNLQLTGIIAPQMTFRIQTKYALYSRTSGKHDKQKVETVCKS